MSRFVLIAICVFLFLGHPIKAQLSTEQLHAIHQEAGNYFSQANGLFKSDREKAYDLYDKAILRYQKMITEGRVQNEHIFYNLGNAHLMKKEIGHAILNYRKSLKYNTSNTNVLKNLNYALSQRLDSIEENVETQVLKTFFFWHYDFSQKTKFVIISLSWFVLLLLITVWVWKGRYSGALAGTLFCLLVAMVFCTSLLLDNYQQKNNQRGVIVADEIIARQGDGENYPKSFERPLHAGTEFQLLESRNGWFHIELANGQDAWIKIQAAGII